MYSETAKIVHCKNIAEKLSMKFESAIEFKSDWFKPFYKEDTHIYNKLFPITHVPRGEKREEIE